MKFLPIRLRLLLLFFFSLSRVGFAQIPDSIPAYQPPPAPPVHPDNKFTPLKATAVGGCLPTFTYGCSYDDGLNGFAVNGVPLSTNTGCAATGYSTFTTVTTTVSPGKSYSFSATLLSSAYREGVAIWADLNGNQLFETSEKIYETPVLQVAGSVAGAFTIPATATGPMAVRVMAVYNLLNLNLCGNYGYGEVEDYVLNVVSPTGCDLPAAALTGPTIIVQGQSVTLVASQTGDVPYSLTIGNSTNPDVLVLNNQTTATLALSVTPATTTVYSVLAVSNACGVVAGNSSVTVAVQSCDTPSGLSESEKTTYSIRLNWQPVLTASSYTIVWREAGAATSTTSTYGSSSTYTYLNPLIYGKAYEWQIRTNCVNGASTAFSPVRSFTMSCPEPFNTTEVASGSGMQLRWGYQYSSATPINYTIQWRPVGGTWQTINNVCCSSYTLSNLTLGTNYEWQIKTNCPNGSSTAYSTPRTFTAVCGPPSYSYLDYKTSTTARVYWSLSSNTSYIVQWRPQNPANSPFTSATVVNNNAYTITSLTNGTGYDWQVRSACLGGTQSDFTASQSFTTACTSVNYIFTPTVGPNSANLSWPNLGTGIRYNLVWQAVGSPTSTTVNLLTASSYTLTGLTTGTVYIHKIQTVCTDGSVSGLSSPGSFTTQCNAPSYISSVTTYSNSVYLYWGMSGDIGPRYDVVYRVVGSPTSSTISSLTTTGTTLSGLLSNTAYEWQVRTKCSDESASAFTTAQIFTTTGCLAPSGLTDYGITSSGAYLFWNGTGVGIRYDVVYQAADSPTSTTVTSLTNSSLDLSNLISNTAYTWQVRTICTDGSVSAFSPVRSFTTTACLAPSGLTELHIASTAALLRWSIQVGSRYVLQWRQTGSTTGSFSSTTTATYTGSRSQEISGLIDGGVYEWQVSAICADGSVSPVASRTFTTGCNAPTQLFNQTITSTGASVSWSGVYVGPYRVRWRLTGTTTWTESSTFTGSNYAITGLTNGNVYEWQPGLVCWNNSVAYPPNSLTFTTMCTSPNIYSPSVYDTFATLYWISGDTGTLYDVQYQQAGVSTWISVTGITTNSLSLTGLTPSIPYNYQIRARCGDGQISPFGYTFSFTTSAACGIITSIRDGFWWNTSTWSCNRVPTAADPVEIRHRVTVPSYYTGYANRLGYGAGGRLIYETAGKLKLGQ